MATPGEEPAGLPPEQPGASGSAVPAGSAVPPQPPKRRFPVWAIVVLSIVGVCCIGGGIIGLINLLAGGGGEQSTTSTPSTASTVKIGTPARDGNFEFLVSSVECGRSSVGSDVTREEATGQFCLVNVKITNVGKDPQAFSDTEQKAFGPDGSEYSADSAADLAVNESDQVLYNEINPGNSVTGTVVFDIPTTSRIVKLELHDSSFSGGVVVNTG